MQNAEPTDLPLYDKWQACSLSLGISNSIQVFQALMARYNEAHRFYHTAQHIEECFLKLDETSEFATNAAEIAMAIWFHDAIYDPLQHNNEQLSAELANSTLLSLGIGRPTATRIGNLIMSTIHHENPVGMDAAIIIDVDLAILAASPGRFAEYEQQIRNEYAHVESQLFRTKRTEILESFIKRASIFNTPYFIRHHEATARMNIRNALEQLYAK